MTTTFKIAQRVYEGSLLRVMYFYGCGFLSSLLSWDLEYGVQAGLFRAFHMRFTASAGVGGHVLISSLYQHCVEMHMNIYRYR